MVFNGDKSVAVHVRSCGLCGSELKQLHGIAHHHESIGYCNGSVSVNIAQNADSRKNAHLVNINAVIALIA